MFEDLLHIPAVAQYLQFFPHSHWEQCLELTLALGIQTAMQLFPYGCSLDSLARAVLPYKDEKPTKGDVDQGKRTEKRRPEPSGAVTARSQLSNGEGEKTLNPPKRRGSSDTAYLKMQEGRTWEHTQRKDAKIDRKRSYVPKSLKNVTSRIKADVKRDIERYFTPQKPLELIKGEDGSDSRPKSMLETDRKPVTSPLPPRTHYPPRPAACDSRPVTKEKSRRTTPAGSANSSLLIEPRTNTAFIEKLTGDEPWKPTESTENSVMKITDKFLADPVMTTLSNRTSPRLTETETGFRPYY